jgi:hypothetical protein
LGKGGGVSGVFLVAFNPGNGRSLEAQAMDWGTEKIDCLHSWDAFLWITSGQTYGTYALRSFVNQIAFMRVGCFRPRR